MAEIVSFEQLVRDLNDGPERRMNFQKDNVFSNQINLLNKYPSLIGNPWIVFDERCLPDDRILDIENKEELIESMSVKKETKAKVA